MKIQKGIFHEEIDGRVARVRLCKSDIIILCTILNQTQNSLSSYVPGTVVVVLMDENENYIIGADQTESEKIVPMYGEKLIRLSDNVAIIGRDNNSFGFFRIYEKEDGTYRALPLFSFDSEGSVTFSGNALGSNISGMQSYNIEKTSMGFLEESKVTRLSDKSIGPSVIETVKGTTSGPELKRITVLTPSPIQPTAVSAKLIEKLPLTLIESSTPSIPKKISYQITPASTLDIIINKTDITIKTPMASVIVSLLGDITIKNKIGSSIVISKLGSIKINGKTGADVVGTNVSLVETIQELIQTLAGMTILTPTGPGSVNPADIAKLIATKTKLTVLKGKA